MAYFNLLLFLCVTCMLYLSSDALLREALVSHRLAKPHKFTYHIPIMGKANGTLEKNLICSAGIISKTLILTAAQCFVDDRGNHRELTYTVYIDTIDVNITDSLEIYIDLIYLVSRAPFYIDDIAVAKLARELDIGRNPYINELKIPNDSQDFKDQKGIVAGYGHYLMPHHFLNKNWNSNLRHAKNSDGLLRYFKVHVMAQKNCMIGHQHPSDFKQLCAKPESDSEKKQRGFCDYDSGSPLVIGKIVVAVASSWHSNCDDTAFGGLYTKVSKYESFIKAIIGGTPLNSTIIYRNRVYVY